VTWIRAILIEHTSYLITLPDLVKSLSGLYLIVDSRLSVFKKLLKLSGRMDLLLSQISTTRAAAISAPVIYEEEDSEEDQEQIKEHDDMDEDNVENEDMEEDKDEDGENGGDQNIEDDELRESDESD